MAADIDAVTAAGLGIGAVLAVVVIGLVIGAVFMAIGAALAGIRDRTFGKAVMATFLVWIVAGVVSGVAGFFFPLLGLVVYVLLAIVLVKAAYGCGVVQALIALVMSVVVSLLLSAAIVFAIGGGVAAFDGLRGKTTRSALPPEAAP